jgi:branched-chain amino acid transport system ATP-binding protein
VLQLSEVDVFYGRAQALFGVSLEAERGEVVALLGRNGAGKTTTLRTIMGLLPAAKGQIRFNDRSIRGRAPHAIARRGIGYVPEDRRIFNELTVGENLKIGQRGRRRGLQPWTRKRLFQLFPNLAGLRRRRGGDLSGGEQKMLSLGRTLMGNPSLLLLDEPTEGLAPLVVEEMAETISFLKEEGVTVVMSEQNIHFASRVADTAYIIESGAIAVQGAMEELSAAKKLWQQHLAL